MADVVKMVVFVLQVIRCIMEENPLTITFQEFTMTRW